MHGRKKASYALVNQTTSTVLSTGGHNAAETFVRSAGLAAVKSGLARPAADQR